MDMVLGGGSSRSTGRRSGQVAVFVHLHAASSTRRFQFPQTSVCVVSHLSGSSSATGWVGLHVLFPGDFSVLTAGAQQWIWEEMGIFTGPGRGSVLMCQELGLGGTG